MSVLHARCKENTISLNLEELQAFGAGIMLVVDQLSPSRQFSVVNQLIDVDVYGHSQSCTREYVGKPQLLMCKNTVNVVFQVFDVVVEP